MKIIPPHTGHRKRLKERFMKNPRAVHDYEIYEMLLFYIHRRRDVKNLAKLLFSACTWNEILTCTEEKYSHITSIINNLVDRLRYTPDKRYIIIDSKISALDYCRDNFTKVPIRILWLNKQCELVGETHLNLFDENTIMQYAIKFKASNLIIVLVRDISPDKNIFVNLIEALSAISVILQEIIILEDYMESVVN